MPRTRTYGLDIDTIRFAQRVKQGSGTTILPEPLKQINKFVVGIKKLKLWDSMVCWPMRSIHNAGTGSAVYSLGGLGVYNGSMVNSPTWGIYGILSNGSNQKITTSYTPLSLSISDISCCASLSLVGKNSGSCIAGNRPGFTFAGFWQANITASIAWSTTGSNAQANASPSAQQNVPFFYHGLVGTRSDATQLYAETGVNTNNRVTSTSNGTTSTTPKVLTLMEDGNGGNLLQASLNFVSIYQNTITKELSDLIFTLHKRTLGIGLNLP